MTKTCFVCKRNLDISSFYKHPKMSDGYLNKCKDCCNEQAKARRLIKIEQIRAYDRNRPNKAERKQKEKEYKARMKLENPEKYDRVFREPKRRYLRKYQDKTKAKNMLGDAIRYGKIKRPDTCSLCGIKCKPQAHHYDYSKPLDVVWVCVSCHANIHNRLRVIKRENKALVKIPVYNLASKVLDDKINA